MNEYVDKLSEEKHKKNIWKDVALGLMSISWALAVGFIYYVMETKNRDDRRQFVLAPGIASLTTVRPGELSKGYIEEVFRYVTGQNNSWTYKNVEENYQRLFKQFYSHDLVTRTEANLDLQKYFSEAESRRLISMWEILPEKSEYHWCEKARARTSTKGLACGIVTGIRTLYADHNVPVSEEQISYLIYALNKAPTENNFFATQITRIRIGKLSVLKAELAVSLKEGVLPSENGGKG